MGVRFFIGPFDPILWKDDNPDPAPQSDLRINPVTYSRKLIERWPNAKRTVGADSWTLNELDRPGIYVFLQDNLQYVSFDVGVNFTDFILWHRQMIPPQYALFLFNDTSWDSLQLSVNTTREEIQAFTQFYES